MPGQRVARTIVQGKGLATSVTMNRVPMNVEKPHRFQWFTCPGVNGLNPLAELVTVNRLSAST